jgi:hypothetical protein
MKVKTSALTGAALDWAVAKCEVGAEFIGEIDDPHFYSTDWAHGGPIIEREMISVSREFTSSAVEWAAWTPAPIRDDAEAFGYGDSPLIAAMRCYVASNLGDEVEIPEELNQ